MKQEIIRLIKLNAVAGGTTEEVTVSLQLQDEGFVVNSFTGLVGTEPTPSTANPKADAYAPSKKAYDKLVAKFCADGFKPNVSPGATLEAVGLYCTEGSSDKEYHIQLQEEGGKFVVMFQYGRRGSTLKPGTKTETAVEYPAAKKAYDDLEKRQVGKGYTYGTAGKSFVGTVLAERITGIYPQLLNELTEAEAQRLLRDPDWVLQEKHDGHRRMYQQSTQELLGINRKGLVTGVPGEVAEHIEVLADCAPYVMDSELIGGESYLFDVMEWRGKDVRALPYSERLVILDEVQGKLAAAPLSSVKVTKTAYTTEEKLEMYEWLRATNREGAVFKRKASSYVPGRPTTGGDQLKRKFWEIATVIIGNVSPAVRSVEMILLDADGHDIFVGNLTIHQNRDIPEPGTLADVKYLYAYLGGSMVQSSFHRVRLDIERAACTLTQLKYKAEPAPAGVVDQVDAVTQ